VTPGYAQSGFVSNTLFMVCVHRWKTCHGSSMMSGMMISEDQDKQHLVAVPPNWADSELTQAVALLIKKDVPGTRLLLHGKVPRILASYSSTESAGAIARELSGLGLQVQVCNDHFLRSPPSLVAHSMRLLDGEILFADREGALLRLRTGGVNLLVTGQLDITEERTVVRTSTKLNLPATLLTGGIPVRRKVSQKTVESVTNTVRFAFIMASSQSQSLSSGRTDSTTLVWTRRCPCHLR
jgi:hypothetical protein